MKRMLYVLLFLPGMSWATTYKCVDQGHVVYATSPCGENSQILPFNDDQAISQGKLTLHMDMNHGYRAPGTVNGFAVSFVVDTGASNTTISKRVAEASGIHGCIATGYTSTANGVVSKCVVTVPEITFGNFHIKNLTVSVLPNLNIDGLLGMDVLHRMKIHQEDGVMYISSQ